jgi:two-component sensor histidine kinase
LFSELVMNAVKHAGGATRIVVVHGHQTLRFEGSRRTHGIPAVRDITGPAGGFGLRIVAQLSESWGAGADGDRQGRVVERRLLRRQPGLNATRPWVRSALEQVP